jgi:hypothetical protein
MVRWQVKSRSERLGIGAEETQVYLSFGDAEETAEYLRKLP